MGAVRSLDDNNLERTVTWVSGVSCVDNLPNLQSCSSTEASTCYGRYAVVQCIEKSESSVAALIFKPCFALEHPP